MIGGAMDPGLAPMPEDFGPGKGDEKLMVSFRIDPIFDAAKSEAEGRPYYVDGEWIKILIPGDKTNVIDRPANEIDRRRHAIVYARFKQGLADEAQNEGTPLKEWPMISRSVVENLRFHNVFTVEQLASVSDLVKLRMPGLTKLSEQASIWLERTKATGEVAKITTLLENQSGRISTLEQALKEVMQENDRLRLKAGEKMPGT
jgi:hypothetical protein